MSADLHIHTIYSDGLLTPEEVVEKARGLHLKAIAITDHDTVDGITPALNAAKEYIDLEIIPGIELSTEWRGEEVHVLGYYLNYKNFRLKTALLNLQNERRIRAKKIVKKLENIEIGISLEDVYIKSKGSSIGRPHIASVLVDKGYAGSVEEAFENYLIKGKPAFVPRRKLTPFDAVNLVKQYSGIPVLAHPGLIRDQCIINELISAGIMGIETIHKKHSATQTEYYTKLAFDNNLLLTGGSDSHGETPLLLGNYNIPIQHVERLRQARKTLTK